MESLGEKVKQALAQCGWNGSKRQEGIEALEQLDLFGFYLFPAARIFVEQFGDEGILPSALVRCEKRDDPNWMADAGQRACIL